MAECSKNSESSMAKDSSSKIIIFLSNFIKKKTRVSVIRLVVFRASSVVDHCVPSLMDIMGT